jgi:type II secretory pathway component PulF
MSALSHTPGSFFFVAARMGGGRKVGLRAAASERALADALRKERLLLLRRYRLPAWAGGSSGSGLSLKARAELNEQLGQLLSRGVPLVEALEVTASTVHASAREQIEKMRELVAAGSSFADAAQKTAAFDRVTVAVYRAAERTGDLAGAAKQLAKTNRRQVELRSKALTLTIYPSIVLTIGIFVGVFMLTVVVPKIGQAMSSLGSALPAYTQLVMGVGNWARENFFWLLIGFGALVLLGLVRRRAVVRWVLSASRRVPLLREVILAQESARFFSVMAAMTRSGVPLADALGVANDAIGLPQLKRQLTTLRMRLIEGGVLRNLIEKVEAFPLATRRLLIAAERAGDLETAFETLADDMTAETDRRTTRLMVTLEPVLLLLLFAFVGSLLMAFMMPMITAAGSAL